ncbi:hypothetical protein K466DRAFT_333349 [Polyporus arcularius HHB13444]|uniref:DUF6534 domain-containing protein n=1 Tax=Polyporus arcularius HHB13444 TaxID=1314778 RepID=A0A5C3PSD6_9APHY|nr:hypothetical protein K466DRAFT_333349 [Polyporus arcularius HHB13444]
MSAIDRSPPLSSLCIPSEENLASMGETFGALLLGTFSGTILYGLGLHQLYRYFQLYPKDLIFVRSVVILTMIFETLHTFLTLHVCYFYLVDNYLCPGRLQQTVWSINLLAITTGMTMSASQMFFARRLYKVGPGYRKVVFLAMAFLVGEFAFAVTSTVELYLETSFYTFGKMTRSRTGMKLTDDRIDVLIIYTINTGLATGVFNVISLILAVAMSEQFLYVCFSIVTTRLYGNTLLAAVNSRVYSVPGGLEAFELQTMPRSQGILTPAIRSTTAPMVALSRPAGPTLQYSTSSRQVKREETACLTPEGR